MSATAGSPAASARPVSRTSRYAWAHLFAAVRPATGEDFALVLPHVSTEAVNVLLAGFGAMLAADEHAAMVLDGTGWHTSGDLRVPDNVTLVPPPAYSPQLNPVERVGLHLRERHLSHRLLDDHDAILDALCAAWNKLAPDRLRPLTNYPCLETIKTYVIWTRKAFVVSSIAWRRRFRATS